MPTPKKNETREHYISRCIPYVQKEGTAKNPKQAVAVCYGLWHEHHKGGKKNAKKNSCGGDCPCEGCRREKTIRASLYQVRSHKAQDLKIFDVPALGVLCSDTELSATGVLTTNDPDLVGDLVIPAGVDLHHHQLNPTVLLEHNLVGAVGGGWQIGRCETPEGEYTVYLDDDRLLQKSYFSQSLPEAKQTYLLIKEGILRGNSMGFKENKVVPRAGGGRIIQACRLYEVTWTCLPMNPYALDTMTSIFSRGRLDGEPLTLTIKSMLQPWVAPRKYYPTEIKETHMFEHKSQDDYEEKDQPQDDMEVEQKSDDAPEEEKTLKDKADEQEGQQGEKILKALVDHLDRLREEVEEAKGTTENERVQDCLDGWDAKADEMIEDLQEVLDDEYSDEADDDEGEPEEEEKPVEKKQKSRKSRTKSRTRTRKSQISDDNEPTDEEIALQRSIERKIKILGRLSR